MSHIQIGHLTAVRNTAVPMTVTDAYQDLGSDSNGWIVNCVYTVNGELKTFSASEDVFIGFGDELIFRDGVFVDAYESNPDLSDDDDEDDEEDSDDSEEEEDLDEDDEPDADHEDVRN